MERSERSEKDDAQKAKLIFISLAVLVAVLLIWSFAAGNKARSERDTAVKELEAVKQDNAKLEQMVKDLTQENDALKKKVVDLESKAKAKKAAPKKKAAKTKKTSRKKTN